MRNINKFILISFLWLLYNIYSTEIIKNDTTFIEDTVIKKPQIYTKSLNISKGITVTIGGTNLPKVSLSIDAESDNYGTLEVKSTFSNYAKLHNYGTIKILKGHYISLYDNIINYKNSVFDMSESSNLSRFVSDKNIIFREGSTIILPKEPVECKPNLFLVEPNCGMVNVKLYMSLIKYQILLDIYSDNNIKQLNNAIREKRSSTKEMKNTLLTTINKCLSNCINTKDIDKINFIIVDEDSECDSIEEGCI
ncbi:MAG: hypothetical protein IJ481_02090 [Alphaproteobacteria bacterium]|nr:hypothetical protein [Alphaproteobacteria bacterium]